LKRTALRPVVGLGLGLGFAVLEMVLLGVAESAFHDHTVQPMRSFLGVFGILNAPAEGLSYLWSNVFQLPPRSEVAWVVVPFAAMLIQWGLVGFLLGLWWRFKSASSHPESKR
jgi:hypothetical protein